MSEIPATQTEICLAELADFVEIKAVLDRANQYAVARSGVPGWTAMEYVYGGLHRQIENGECYVIRNQDNAITSAIALSETTDMWGKASRDGQALYFTKLIKNPDLAAPAEGLQLISFAAAQALRRHKPFVRCDTVAELDGLVGYYQELGFESKGNFVYESSGRPGVRLEAASQNLLDNAARQA